MEEKKNAGPPDILAKVISVIFSSIIRAVVRDDYNFYCSDIILVYSIQVKKILLFVVATNNVSDPGFINALFQIQKFISSWAIGNQEGRRIPLLCPISFFFY